MMRIGSKKIGREWLIYGGILLALIMIVAIIVLVNGSAKNSSSSSMVKTPSTSHSFKGDSNRTNSSNFSGGATYDSRAAEEERVRNIKNDKIADEWRFVKDAGKPVTINNKSSNGKFSCYEIAMENKSWVPGGWTLNCVDKLNVNDVVDSETAGLTYPEDKTIYILNKWSDNSIYSVMIHELAHAYNFTYFNDDDRGGIAGVLKKGWEDYYSKDYKNSPDEEWARGYSYCYTHLEVNPVKYPKIDCKTVEKYVNDVRKRLGVDIKYKYDTIPSVPLNSRKNLPAIPYVK